MTASSGLGDLKTEEWQELQLIAERFEKAWKKAGDQGEPPDLARFLPPPEDPLRKQVLQELIKTDLEARWRRHQSTGIEFYLQRFPELGKAKELPASLLYEEYRIRQTYGDKPPVTAYQRRFPDQFNEFQRLVNDEPMATNIMTITAPPPPATPAPAAAKASAPSGIGGTASSGSRTLGMVGDYNLVERIGSGSFGEVWKSLAPGGIPVAVKVLTRPVDHETAKRELDSLELIKSIRHPFLLSTQAYFVSEERLYIIMELADGSLRSRLKECRKEGHNGIPLEELIPYFHESAEALDFLHGKKVQHRDVKPDNILLLERHVKVADFGLARLQGERSLVTATSSGTPAYMGPEVWSGKFSEHSDQYALAFTYAELRLDRRVFSSVSLPEMMNDHLNTTPDLEPMPEAEKEVVLRAMAKDPAKRFASCKEFVQALDLATMKERRGSMPVPEGTALSEAPTADYSTTGTDPWSTMAGTLASGGGVSTAGRTEPLPWRPPTVSRRRMWVGGFLLAGVFLATFIGVKQFSPKVPGSFDLKDPETVLLGQGESKAAKIPIQRHDFKGAINLTFDGVPDNIEIKPESDGTDGEGLPITVESKQKGRSGTFHITVNAQSGDIHHNVTLTVSTIWLPKGFTKGEGDPVEDKDGRVFYQKIVKDVGGEKVEFVCIPNKEGSEINLPTYYIMVDKVWFGLFKKFAVEPNITIKPGWKTPQGYIPKDKMPVTNVYALDACRFAKRLGGKLPTAEQWDKAAGRYDRPRNHEGPFRGEWKGIGSVKIALNRTQPMNIGEAEDDVSPHGCRDMAGNGEEWTNSLDQRPELLSSLDENADPMISVIQRSRSYDDKDRPFLFSSLEKKTDVVPADFLGQTDKKTSFRVALNPDGQ
jgi:serine/threonine protein kinase/formylglycine-generating enzyme required for sulfatase activity